MIKYSSISDAIYDELWHWLGDSPAIGVLGEVLELKDICSMTETMAQAMDVGCVNEQYHDDTCQVCTGTNYLSVERLLSLFITK